jgi:hypothetical protein
MAVVGRNLQFWSRVEFVSVRLAASAGFCAGEREAERALEVQAFEGTARLTVSAVAGSEHVVFPFPSNLVAKASSPSTLRKHCRNSP